MQILFAITVLCLLVLLWAGLAIRRHVRSAARERAERQTPPAKAIIEVELKQELRTAHAEKGFFGSLSDPLPSRNISRTRQAVRDSALRAAVAAVPAPAPEPVEGVEAPQPEPVVAVEPHVEFTPEITPDEHRKPPVSIGGAKFERLDMAHFNKDLGDLSDPYQIPRAATRNRS